MTSRAFVVRMSLASIASERCGVRRLAASRAAMGLGVEAAVLLKLCSLHDRFPQIFVRHREVYLFRHVQHMRLSMSWSNTNCLRNSS